MADSVRVDVWLWATRIVRTRALAKAACASGSVRVNGTVAKASRSVRLGDVVTGRIAGRERTLEVLQTPSKRLGARLAAEAVLDSSPPPPPKGAPVLRQAVRDRGSGRPTKRDRRQIEQLRGRRGDD